MKNRRNIAALIAGISLCGFATLAQPVPNPAESDAPRGPGRQRMAFSTLDLNGDGSISPEEFEKARSAMRGRGPGGPRADRGEGDRHEPRALPREESNGERTHRNVEERPEAAKVDRAGDGAAGRHMDSRRQGPPDGVEGERPHRERDRDGRENSDKRGRGAGPESRRGERREFAPNGPRGWGAWERPMRRGEEERGFARRGEREIGPRHADAGRPRRFEGRGDERGGRETFCPQCGRPVNPSEGDGPRHRRGPGRDRRG